VIGAPFQTFVRTGDQAEVSEILQSSTSRKVRYVLAAADGTFIPAQLAFSRLPVDETEAVCVVVTDLTEHEEKEGLAAALQNLRAAQQQLQQQNDELARARKAAEDASDAKDNFLAALSHELRTPLTPVLMTAAALESDPSLTPQLREDMSLLRRNVELEARLIDDLLDITRIVRGKIDLRLEVADVHRILAGAIEICRSDLTGKGLRLIETLGASNAHAEVDSVRVQQILWNLLRNAVKFTPAAGQIIVRTYNVGPELRIEVADSGIGIDGDSIAKIFTPFEQTDRYITQRFGGLGLGLAISKRLAELHGGNVIAHSDGRGRGSTFTLSLPCCAQRVGAPSDGSPTALDGSAPRLRILLVEDHEDTRKSMVRLLSRKHEVVAVHNVAAAMQAAGRERFNLVISDLGLPDGSGLDLMQRLRERHNLHGICLSGYGMDSDVARSAAAGFRHHLIKPIDLQKLESAIASLAN
jgi:signal transduction histidine kinase/CheY-like chemotaxis protein